MIPKLNLFSTFAALALFFLPWIDIRCSDKSMGTQTGIQTIYGGATASDLMEAENKSNNSTPAKDDKLGISFLVAIAFLATIFAIFASIQVFRNNNPLSNKPGLFSAIAFVAIVLQAYLNFPVENSMIKQLSSKSSSNPSNPMDDSAVEMVKSMIGFEFTPFYYLTLAALALPILIMANNLLDKAKKQ